MKDNKQLMDTIIYVSKDIIKAKTALRILKEGRFLVNRLSMNIISGFQLSQIESDIQLSIMEAMIRVGKLMNKLLKSIYNISVDNKFHISTSELIDGYCELHGTFTRDKNGKQTGPTKRLILFLTDYKDAFYDIKAGEVCPFDDVSDILLKLKPLLEAKDVTTKFMLIKDKKYEKIAS